MMANKHFKKYMSDLAKSEKKNIDIIIKDIHHHISTDIDKVLEFIDIDDKINTSHLPDEWVDEEE